ncbi:MAG: hypothetical protein BAA04_01535 [Firmicutes bacterium ZCTH02-B6]|nr:MAG: hypothetical protein BAA04_01535 [Firmicutes bacterium ZCTH02-B6]
MLTNLHVQIPEELHLWLRLQAARRHVKLRHIVEEALNLYREHVERGDTEGAAVDGDKARSC